MRIGVFVTVRRAEQPVPTDGVPPPLNRSVERQAHVACLLRLEAVLRE